MSEAQAAVKAGLALNPTFTIRRFRASAFSDNPTYLAQRERIYDGMRKAGVPEECKRSAIFPERGDAGFPLARLPSRSPTKAEEPAGP